jgi:hypothetical protein
MKICPLTKQAASEAIKRGSYGSGDPKKSNLKILTGRAMRRRLARGLSSAEKQRIKEKAALARQPIQKQQLSAAILPTAAHKCKEAA